MDENSQTQLFLKESFEVFSVDTVTQATLEHRGKFSDGSQGFIDMFWPGVILVEMKSKGKDLDAAAMKKARAGRPHRGRPALAACIRYSIGIMFGITRKALVNFDR